MTSESAQERDELAGEYVLGTLPAEQRIEVQRRLPNVAEIRATVPVVMVVAGSVAIAVLAISDQVNSAQTFERWIIGLPIAALGVLIGNRLAKQIPAVIMKRTIALLLIASGLSLTRHIWL